MVAPDASEEDGKMGIIWTIIIGFVAGLIAKFIMPGPNEPSGFIMTTRNRRRGRGQCSGPGVGLVWAR
jgi:hypothetical protein